MSCLFLPPCFVFLYPLLHRFCGFSLLSEDWFLCHRDPLGLERPCTREELQLAVMVFEEMQVCLRLGVSSPPFSQKKGRNAKTCPPTSCFSMCTEGRTLRVLERGEVTVESQLFFPSLCPSPKGEQSPLDAVLEELLLCRPNSQDFSCSGLCFHFLFFFFSSALRLNAVPCTFCSMPHRGVCLFILASSS